MRTATKSIDLISKKTNYLHVQHTLMYISLPLFFTHTMPFCTTKTSNFLITHYFLWRNCRMCSPKILVLGFLFTFIFFHCRSFSPCWPLAFLICLTAGMKFSRFSPLFLITRSGSFSVIHVSVDIKNNVEKDSILFVGFPL